MAKLKFSYPVFQQPSAVVHGRGSIRSVLAEKNLAGAAIFVSGQSSVQRRFDEALFKQCIERSTLRVLVKPRGEPDWPMIEQGAVFLAEKPPSRIIGLGGGSVLDWCRLAWLRSQGLLDADGGTSPADDRARPVVCLAPTTCATGAEAAAVAVYSSQGRKIPVVSRSLLADQVILDAQFLDDLSEASLAAFLCDAVSHAIEAYCSIVPSTFAKEAAVGSLSIVLEQFEAPASPERLEHLLEGSYLGGLAASHCSVGVVHAFAHSAACWGVSHAAGNATALPAGIRANRSAPALARLAARVGLGSSVDALAAKVQRIADAAAPTIDRESMLLRLTDETARAALLERMAKDPCLRTNPVRLGADELEAFLYDVRGTIEGR